MNDTVQTLIRTVLKFGGGYLVAKGFATDNIVEVIVAGVLASIGVVWGILHKKPTVAPA